MLDLNRLKVEDLGEIKLQELQLLYLIRNKYRFGPLEIMCRDGIPWDLLKTVERTRLGPDCTYPHSSQNQQSVV
jgi:hypothetical protein